MVFTNTASSPVPDVWLALKEHLLNIWWNEKTDPHEGLDGNICTTNENIVTIYRGLGSRPKERSY